MTNPESPRFVPPALGKKDLARSASLPRWFLREAVQAFGLTPYDAIAFCVIADNLDARGVSTTANVLIAERTGMGRNSVSKSVDTLVHHGLLIRLDDGKRGRVKRYAIPRDIPFHWKD